jgi:hypothetical protein
MQEQLQHTRQQWLQAYYDGDVLQLAQHEHPQFQLHNRLSGHIEGRERHEHIAFAVAHQAWKPARWHIAHERFVFSDDGLQCQVAAEGRRSCGVHPRILGVGAVLAHRAMRV